MSEEQNELNTTSGYVVLEWTHDGNNWRLFQKLKTKGVEADKLSVDYLEEFGRRLLKGKRYRVKSV